MFGGGQKAASGGIQGDVLATDNNTVGMGDAGIKSAIQGSNDPNPDEAVTSFVSGAMAKAGKGLLEGTLQAGTSAVSDKLLDLVGLGGKSAADKGKDTRDYFVFSSRRRHTRFDCDWSSDVCSSDLETVVIGNTIGGGSLPANPPGSQAAVHIGSAWRTFIGGATAEERNHISGKTVGIQISDRKSVV